MTGTIGGVVNGSLSASIVALRGNPVAVVSEKVSYAAVLGVGGTSIHPGGYWVPPAGSKSVAAKTIPTSREKFLRASYWGRGSA